MRLMYNLMSLAEFSAGSAALHWRTFMAGAEIDERHMAELVVEQPSFFTEVAALLTDDRLQAWKLWLKWRVIGSYAPVPVQCLRRRELRASTAPCCQGTPQLRERWKRGVGLVEGALGEAVGKVYVERHFSPVAKQRMDELVANLIKAYRSLDHRAGLDDRRDQGRGAGPSWPSSGRTSASRPSGGTTRPWRSRSTT